MKIYTFWTGNNPMTQNRMRGLMQLKHNSGVDVDLITPKDIGGLCLHPGYEYLSLVHRSDYLRAFFMFYYGGGYCDVKPVNNSWVPAFKMLEDSDAWILGYKELGHNVVAPCVNKPGIKYLLEINWRLLIGCGAFICKPGNPLVADWLNEVDELISCRMAELAAHPGNIMGDNPGYPLGWTELLGDIFHPLILKHNDRVLQYDIIKPDFNKNYR